MTIMARDGVFANGVFVCSPSPGQNHDINT